jgi:hypothetical protein
MAWRLPFELGFVAPCKNLKKTIALVDPSA